MPCRKKSKITKKMVEYIYSPYELDERHGFGHSYDLASTLRSLKEEIRIFKADDGRIIQAHEKQAEVNVVILQSFLELQ